ncbi:MAG: Smr/MutS family protein [Deltaproteobacteria bacterium]|nr:Smr/MutS family protein [Deltaproteobacteria bacterium]
MPKRRLHGITQKRRKKPATALIKQQGTVARTHSTLKPEPFERTGLVEREDLEFHETMRAMDVHRAPWSGEVRQRRETLSQMRFEDEHHADHLFSAVMTHLEIAPMNKTPGSPPAAPGNPVAPDAAKRTTGHAAPALNPPAPPHPLPPSPPQPGSALARTAAPAVPVSPVLPGSPTAASLRSGEGLRFEEEGDPAALMTALMDQDALEWGEKFEGAPKSVQRNAPARQEDLEPDSQIDLHGKTQEEAIQTVQNFILTSHRQRLRHVLIITGRGRNSGEHGPVLREVVYRWLERNGERFVRAFHWAPPRHGGEGALWVSLR